MPRQIGISTNTYKRFVIDAGAAYTGFVSFASPGTLLGATRGGSTLTIEQEIREMEADGARGPVVGSRRITRVTARLVVNFLEHTVESFKRALVGSDSATFNTDWDAISRSLQIENADFLSDVTLLGEVSGSANAMAIKLSNVIADGNFELSLVDKEEGVLAVTFTAHFTADDLDTEPWTLYWPKEA